ncbi:hypothetical protein PHISCL_07713 [Aspergillus sclerotialis]|uniref:Uncharacterized protein n=1 Tax=Aspergillus sclerotialis TaxID=2070753 RepID=A0A3A2ZA03_9EURO|nr:hypothetical protein PHISCL_07713 [Aspergillus sclerotialis]
MPGDSNTEGPHNSKIANKLDPRVHSANEHSEDETSQLGSAHDFGKGGTSGRHNSNIANALDPRVDSQSKENDDNTEGLDPRADPANRVVTGEKAAFE